MLQFNGRHFEPIVADGPQHPFDIGVITQRQYILAANLGGRQHRPQTLRQRTVGKPQSQVNTRESPEEVMRGIQRNQLALLEHADAPAQRLGLFQIVRSQHDGMAVAVELADELPQALAQLDIHAGGRFVENDYRRLVHQSLRHQHPPFHPAG